MENRGRTEKNYKKGVKEAVKQFRSERIDGAKRPVECGNRKTMKERGELPNEEGDVVREHKTMHEEDFWSSWLREDEKSKEERKVEAEGKGEVEGEKRKREGEKEDNETVTVERRCEGLVSVEAFEIFLSRGRCGDAEMCPGKTSWTILRTCLIVSLILVRMCWWCLM